VSAVIGTVAAAIDLLGALLTEAQKISAIIQTQTAAGASTLTAQQWSAITGDDDSSEAALAEAITSLKAAGAQPPPP
jgi:hypothetical protein